MTSCVTHVLSAPVTKSMMKMCIFKIHSHMRSRAFIPRALVFPANVLSQRARSLAVRPGKSSSAFQRRITVVGDPCERASDDALISAHLTATDESSLEEIPGIIKDDIRRPSHYGFSGAESYYRTYRDWSLCSLCILWYLKKDDNIGHECLTWGGQL